MLNYSKLRLKIRHIVEGTFYQGNYNSFFSIQNTQFPYDNILILEPSNIGKENLDNNNSLELEKKVT